MEYTEFIKKALTEASQIALSYFGKVSGTTKPEDNNQVLTQADLDIGKAIIALIQKEYPSYNIIDEEAGIIDKDSEFTFVIDPIDGTSNFANGIPTYGIILGLLKNDCPIAGGVALPAFSEIYLAEKGKGAFCNQNKLEIKNNKNLLSSLAAYGIDSHREDPLITEKECALLANIVLGTRNLRMSGCIFDAMMLAKNKYGVFLGKSSKIWDHVGVHIVIEEAGGVYTDFWGKPINYQNPLTKINENYTWCTASPTLHQEIQKIIHQVK